MKVYLHRFETPLQHPFTIARGTTHSVRSLIVEIQHEGQIGYGEATEHLYYDISLETLTEAVNRCVPEIESGRYVDAEALWNAVAPKCGNSFALAAIDAAAHDLFGKLKHRCTHEMLGLVWEKIPDSSFTIGIDSIPRMIAKMHERDRWGIFKIKLGTENDVEIVRELRAESDAVFRVDANCAWTVEETLQNAEALKMLGVEFIEQPLPADARPEDNFRLLKHSVLPIIADESCLVEADLERCHGFFHGINVKLSKCGGVTPAVRMLRRARELGMKTMVGCMVESSVGISAAAQLLPLLDYADLDGAELLEGDIADGVMIVDGVPRLSDRFGNGVMLGDK